MRALAFLLLLTAAAHASDQVLNVAIGTGASYGDSPGWAIRLGETMDVTHDHDGLIGGSICGYDYWRGADGSGFAIPVGGFLGTRVGAVRSTFTAAVGLLAFESWHGNDGFGIVPQVGTTLGLQLDRTHTITLDARASRHVLAGSDDFTSWSVLVMIGKDFRD